MAKFRQRDYLVPVNPNDSNCLRDFSRDFGTDGFSMDSQNSDEVKRDFTETDSVEAFKDNVKKHFFNDDDFFKFTMSHLHQGGIPYSLQRAMLATLKDKYDGGVILRQNQVDANRVFKIEGESLVIEESVKVKNLYDLSRNQSKFNNEENTPLLEAKAKYVIRKHDNKWEAQVVDVIFDYKNDAMKECLDNRQISTKIKDWFKALFGLNREKDTTHKREPKFLFLTTENEQNTVNQYAGKSIKSIESRL